MTLYTAILTIAAMLVTTGLMPPAALAGPGHTGGHQDHKGHGGHQDHKDHAEHSGHKDHKGHSGHHQGEAPQGEVVDVELLDLELVDQDGRKVKFKSDVIGDRLVVIDTFYTTCGLICPILSALFVNLQHKLGSRLGQDVVLVSVSVDPGTDIPARLKEYAGRYGAKPGWTFLTGGKRTIDRVLRGIGAYSTDYTQHPAMILVGDGRYGSWTRFYEFPPPKLILERLKTLRAARLAKAN
ncbi:MAG: SCO family protein [Planctomycetota bacterium]|jgi:protein SCO1/2